MSESIGANKKKPSEAENELRKGPWTVDEDLALINYIANHGDGVWNSLARSAGLKRTGKSCRLRWLNYLRPDVRRGNITAEEQVLIIELHQKWGNKWSKIAKSLPGRTDNEIKNYWRTRIQKHVKASDHDRHLRPEINGQNTPFSWPSMMPSSSSRNGGPAEHGIRPPYPSLSSSPSCFFGADMEEAIISSPLPNQPNGVVWDMDDLWSFMHFLNTEWK